MVAKVRAGGVQTWNYNSNGDDWLGKCQKGASQSPIAIQVETAATPPTGTPTATFNFGTANDLLVFDTGHGIQVEWKSLTGSRTVVPALNNWGAAKENITIVPVEAFQFHLHSTGEHVVDGFMSPIELHLVTRVDNTTDMPVPSKCRNATCLAVFGLMFKYATDPSIATIPFFETITSNLPEKTGADNAVVVPGPFNLNQLLPANLSYARYSGSLTTPPCNENVAWHVFTEFQTGLSVEQLETLTSATASAIIEKPCLSSGDDEDTLINGAICKAPFGSRTNNRGIMPLNGRPVALYTPSD